MDVVHQEAIRNHFMGWCWKGRVNCSFMESETTSKQADFKNGGKINTVIPLYLDDMSSG